MEDMAGVFLAGRLTPGDSSVVVSRSPLALEYVSGASRLALGGSLP
jgi:hypothetical protein